MGITAGGRQAAVRASRRFRQRDGRDGQQPDEGGLVRRIRTGDVEAWDEFVARYERLVYSVAVRSGLGPEDAYDVTQSTFLTLLESLSTLRSDDRLTSWLMTVAARQSWQVRRRRAEETPHSEVVPLDEQPSLEWELQVAMHDAVHQLGSPCRELVVALFFDPRSPSYTEIARQLDRPIGSIGPMRQRCLTRLRTSFEEGRS